MGGGGIGGILVLRQGHSEDTSSTFLFQQLLLCQHDNLLHHFGLQDVLDLQRQQQSENGVTFK